MSKYEEGLYKEGKRYGKKNKTNCPYGTSDLRRKCLWLAGWHDYQIENGTGLR